MRIVRDIEIGIRLDESRCLTDEGSQCPFCKMMLERTGCSLSPYLDKKSTQPTLLWKDGDGDFVRIPECRKFGDVMIIKGAADD